MSLRPASEGTQTWSMARLPAKTLLWKLPLLPLASALLLSGAGEAPSFSSAEPWGGWVEEAGWGTGCWWLWLWWRIAGENSRGGGGGDAPALVHVRESFTSWALVRGWLHCYGSGGLGVNSTCSCEGWVFAPVVVSWTREGNQHLGVTGGFFFVFFFFFFLFWGVFFWCNFFFYFL